MDSFQQTLREQDAIFYATFPAAALALHTKMQEDQQRLFHQEPEPLPLPLPEQEPRRHALYPAPYPRSSTLEQTTKRLPDKKPPLACLFCRGRKIACGSPLPGSPDKTCNQCQRRSLQCEYPSESRRGMRKKKTTDASTPDSPSSTSTSTPDKS